ncbi:hypothetical protein [Actinoallomurus iriomotensis]|uniref:Uncharacterized protein n=1 Tax=Actinoallomurus iriomotensis TaxID=478107 RepID=A0A9W6RIX9_9ACTN|nr:hypothetical protein [Actinoallomurus iriomotensis]GLY76861.1 hypothetical protein Airi01_051280 [Actinoallomurus iriomotensis]
MLTEALEALAAAGGGAVVQAAGTDVWATARQRVARLFGGGDPARERAELERLDQTAAALAAAPEGDAKLVRTSEESAWQSRFEALLEAAGDAARDQVAHELRGLVAQTRPVQKGSGALSGSSFHGPTAVQIGDQNSQTNNFG